jgi:hypothetical protein
MRRVRKGVKIFKGHKEQEAADIRFYIRLTPRERQRIARELRVRYYGDPPKPIRESRPTR